MISNENQNIKNDIIHTNNNTSSFSNKKKQLKNTIRKNIKNLTNTFQLKNIKKKINETRKMLKDPLISNQINNIVCDTGVNIKYGMSNTLRNLYYGLPIISLLYKHPGHPPKQNSCGVNNQPIETALNESTLVAATLASARKDVDKIIGEKMGNAFDNAGQAAMNFAKDIPPIGAITGANSIAKTIQDVGISVIETSKKISETQKKINTMLDKKPIMFIGPNGVEFKGSDFIQGNNNIQHGGSFRIINRTNKTRKLFRNL